MEELADKIRRKRRLLALPDIPEESDPFRSDMRHLAMCIYFCDQFESKEGGPKYTNLELMDPDIAAEVQAKFEARNGMRKTKLADIIDNEKGTLIEMTFTSGSLRTAVERKRAKQRTTSIIAVSEDLDEIMSTNKEYEEAAEEAMNALKGFVIAQGWKFKMNSSGSMKQEAVVETPKIAEQIRKNLNTELRLGERDPKEALKKIAQQKLSISSKGAFKTKSRNEEGYEAWVCPVMRELEKIQVEDEPFPLQLDRFFKQTMEVRTNGRPIEEKLGEWIRQREYRLKDGDFFFNRGESHSVLGERRKPKGMTMAEAEETGDTDFKRDEKKGRRKCKGLHKEWKDVFKRMLLKGREEIKEEIEEMYEMIRAVGAAGAALHRGTSERLARPLVSNGRMFGFMFKGSSTAKDLRKQANVFGVFFGQHPDGGEKRNAFIMIDGSEMDFYIENMSTNDEWNTAMICADERLLWAKEFQYDFNRKEPYINPITGELEEAEMWKMLNWSKMVHIEELWKPSAISEAQSAMARKIGMCCEAKRDGRKHGAVGGYGDMCQEIEDLVSESYRPQDFFMANICSTLTDFLSG